MVESLSRADSLLGRLNGAAQRLPNPHVLIRPFVCREAIASSHIEGTQSTLGELLADESGAETQRSPDDLREVGNYVRALHYGMNRLREIPLSLRLVRELHAQLMDGARGEHATPGDFRLTQNWIGKPGCTLNTATYVPPPPDALLTHLGKWELFLHEKYLPPLVRAACMHYQFEAIHPFLDGNGRVGRLLISLALSAWGQLDQPFLYLSAFFDATRRDYYSHLSGVTEHNDWRGWIEYFLNGVATQAEDALFRTDAMTQMVAHWKAAAATSGRPHVMPLIDLLAANPFITPRKAEEKLGVAYNTAMRALQWLEINGVVSPVGEQKRGRVFCATKLLDILEAPASLNTTEHTSVWPIESAQPLLPSDSPKPSSGFGL